MNDKQRKIGFSYACNGLKEVFKTEFNFRLHILSSIIVIILGLLLKISSLEWAFIVLSIGLVLITELINSSIEKMMDYIKPEIHPQAKIIKDIAAGAVLVAAIVAALIGIIIFIPKLLVYL